MWENKLPTRIFGGGGQGGGGGTAIGEQKKLKKERGLVYGERKHDYGG